MVKIDARTLKVAARWKLDPCEAPSALAIDRATQRLFAGCRNHVLAVVDANTGKVVTTAKVGDHVDAGVFEASTKRVFFSNGDGTLNIFHADSPDAIRLVETVVTQPGAKTMALDAKTHRVFLTAAEYADGGQNKRKSVKPGTFAVLVLGK
jgi:DNA-binding beta-propeller fold protein YncE